MNDTLLNNRQIHPILNGKVWVWVSRVLLVGVILAHSALYFSNTYPISEGWGANYAELLFAGKVPYRDFYYYLPPLSLWMDAALWKLSFGSLLMFRAWRVLERVVIYVMIFNLLKRYFHHIYAFAGCALAAILCTGDVYDLLGDYNQTMSLLAVLLLYCAIGFVDADSLKQKLINLFLGGLVIGGMFLNKQTIFLGTFLTYFAAITALCVLKKDTHYWQYILAVAIGVLIPLVLTAGYLLMNGAFVPFLEQVFLNVDGKGSLARIIIEGISTRLNETHIWAIILSCAGLTLMAKLVRQEEERSLVNMLRGITLCFAAVLVAMLLQMYKPVIISVALVLRLHWVTLLLIAGCFLPFLAVVGYEIWKKPGKRGVLRITKYIAVGLGSAVVITFPVLNQDFAANLYTKTALFDFIQSDLSLWCMLSMVAMMIWYLLRTGKEENAEHFFFIACAGFSLFYAGVMASGSSPGPAHIIRIALPFLLCTVFSAWIPLKMVSGLIKGGIWTMCIVLCVACVSQKVESSYSWWGSEMEPLSEKTYTTDIPALKGISMSEDRKFLYETVTRLIEENTEEDAVIWGYPHNKLFNIMTGRYNMKTFVPVLFYDVTADAYVLKELELLQENLPDVVVWQTLPNVLTVHETVFRGGEPLKHRDLEEFFAEVLPEEYTLMAAIGDVSVYKRNDDVPFAGEPVLKEGFDWNPVDGVAAVYDDLIWCERDAEWIIWSPVPTAVDAQVYLYITAGDGSAAGNVEISLDGEQIRNVQLKKGSRVIEVRLDVELQPGENNLQISADVEPMEDGYFVVEGFQVIFPGANP